MASSCHPRSPLHATITTILFLLTASCGKHVPPSSSSPQIPATLTDKYTLYQSLHLQQQTITTPYLDSDPRAYSPQNSHHFIHSQCDGSGFTALCHLSGLCPTPPSAAESQTEPGRWYRDADHICYPTASASDISKDMLLMIIFDLYVSQDLAALVRMQEYGKKHNWIMGDPITAIGRVYMTPPLQNTLAASINKLQGKPIGPITTDFSLGLKESSDFLANTGSAAHLDVLHVLLRGDIYGYITSGEKADIRTQSERQPNNALFQFAQHKYGDGIQDATFALLEDARYYPNSRLPASKDRCEEYLHQRDEDTATGGDWAPCPGEDVVHSGTDFGLVMRLLAR